MYSLPDEEDHGAGGGGGGAEEDHGAGAGSGGAPPPDRRACAVGAMVVQVPHEVYLGSGGAPRCAKMQNVICFKWGIPGFGPVTARPTHAKSCAVRAVWCVPRCKMSFVSNGGFRGSDP